MKFQAKNIGREFVRRYYTILNKSPENLHCFYNDDAKFVHDDVDVKKSKTISVVGKAAIREAVLARLLRHRHRCTIVDGVDTIETINNGFVVKVFGEIAYGAEEMRPFDQTFILGAVSPVQLYVYNEIFRYRDVASVQHSPLVTISRGKAPSAAENSQPVANNDEVAALDLEQINEIQTQHLKSLLQDASRAASTQIPTTKIKAASQSGHISERTNKLFQDKCIITIGNVLNPNIEFDESSGSDTAVTDPDSGGELAPTATDDTQEPFATARRKSTYAESLKFVSKEKCDPVSSSLVEKVNIPPAEAEKEVGRPGEGETELASIGKPNQINVKPNKSVSEVSPPKIDSSPSSDSDILQVFIGNISHRASESELRSVFAKFGPISRFRIHTNPSKANRPNYAFVTYENIDGVRKCLANRNSIYYPENAENGQKLNVNGDETLMEEVQCGESASGSHSAIMRRRTELKQFHKNFVLASAPSSADQRERRDDSAGDRKRLARNQRRRSSAKA